MDEKFCQKNAVFSFGFILEDESKILCIKMVPNPTQIPSKIEIIQAVGQHKIIDPFGIIKKIIDSFVIFFILALFYVLVANFQNCYGSSKCD